MIPITGIVDLNITKTTKFASHEINREYPKGKTITNNTMYLRRNFQNGVLRLSAVNGPIRIWWASIPRYAE